MLKKSISDSIHKKNEAVGYCKTLILLITTSATVTQFRLKSLPRGFFSTLLDEFVASTRINRYEVGVHEPDVGTARRLAEAMAIPLSYLYADDDLLARMILAFARIPKRKQQATLLDIENDTSRLVSED